MATNFFTNSQFDLAETFLDAGSYRNLVFAVYDSAGSPVSLAGATITWYLAPYGNSSSVLSKTGVSGSATNQFIVPLTGTDTLTFSGKYVQQYLLTDASGSPFRPSRGILNFYPALV